MFLNVKIIIYLLTATEIPPEMSETFFRFLNCINYNDLCCLLFFSTIFIEHFERNPVPPEYFPSDAAD